MPEIKKSTRNIMGSFSIKKTVPFLPISPNERIRKDSLNIVTPMVKPISVIDEMLQNKELALTPRKDRLPKLPTNNVSSGDITRYAMFVSSLPSNLAKSEEDYNLYRAWELDGKPINKSQSSLVSMQGDGLHMNSVIYNPTRDEYEFLKSKNHVSLKDELDWYNSKEGDTFRNKYKLDDSSDFFKYIKR